MRAPLANAGLATLARVAVFAASVAASLCASAGPDPREVVTSTERAFAATMAGRDATAFAAFVADDAVFFGDDGPLRGKAAILARWGRYFAAPDAPFSWEPDRVEVLASGALASSSGPVRDRAGAVIARFSSIWRRDDDGRWRIVFDQGERACAP